MAKMVNLYGCTTAEKLVALEKAVNDLYSALGELGFYVSKEVFVNEETLYTAQELTQEIDNEQFIGRPVLFINSNILAYVNTYNPQNEQFTVLGAVTIKGDKGDKGDSNDDGIAELTSKINLLTEDVNIFKGNVTSSIESLQQQIYDNGAEINDTKSQLLSVNEDLQNTKNTIPKLYRHTLRWEFDTARANNSPLILTCSYTFIDNKQEAYSHLPFFLSVPTEVSATGYGYFSYQNGGVIAKVVYNIDGTLLYAGQYTGGQVACTDTVEPL